LCRRHLGRLEAPPPPRAFGRPAGWYETDEEYESRRLREEQESASWLQIAQRCIGDEPRLQARDIAPGNWPLAAEALRDLVPNPFSDQAWNQEWLTSTVCDLAAVIYERHEYGAMPILADALQDAGCDDEQILTHCRANKPHARGCWVLDAILGKA
jgi:hypothetical protein